MTLATYFVCEQMTDGKMVIIRPPKPGERAGGLDAIQRGGGQPAWPRVPAADSDLSEDTIEGLANLVDRVVLIAELDEAGATSIVGAGHYVLIGQHKAELAVTVSEEYRGRGIGTQLTRHLVGLANAARLNELVADVSPNNMAMRKVLSKFGFRKARGRDPKLLRFVLPII